VKKFINSPDFLVPEALEGLGAAYPEWLRVDTRLQIVTRAGPPRPGKVGVLSGGGSGHEPMHSGFVGRGMLDAACCGQVFTSPATGSIISATRAIDAGAGVLYVIKNYTGDIMNFGIAAEAARAHGSEVESVIVADDVALGDVPTGRRGTGATMLVQKIAGAQAERGAPLGRVADTARRASERSGSFGVALTSCVNPVLGRPTISLDEDEMEVGIGIHGEPGRRQALVKPAASIVEEMATAIIDDMRPPRGAEVLAFVNGLGGTPLIELYLVYGELERLLAARGLRPVRRIVGNYVTSLDTAGLSISLLLLDEELMTLWDDPVLTPGLRWKA
jgi:phosphoenolpyruvate---glycerone phosphotransferase subunit DhaK